MVVYMARSALLLPMAEDLVQMTAKQLIVHLTEGLAALGVEDAPIVLWTSEGSIGIEPEDMGPSPTAQKGFFMDDSEFGSGASIHLSTGVEKG